MRAQRQRTGSGRITKKRPLPQLNLCLLGALHAQPVGKHEQRPSLVTAVSAPTSKQAAQQLCAQQHCPAEGKENSSPSAPCPREGCPANSGPHQQAQPTTLPYLFQPTGAAHARRTARACCSSKWHGSGRTSQPRGFHLLLHLPPPPAPPPAPPTPLPEPAPDLLPAASPLLASQGLPLPPGSPHIQAHYSPVEGVPEHITPGRPLLATPAAGLAGALALSAPGSPVVSSSSVSLFSWPTPMEGMPERPLGLTGHRCVPSLWLCVRK